MEGKGKYTMMSKVDAKIRLEYSDETLILRRNFFSECSKHFSIGLMNHVQGTTCTLVKGNLQIYHQE